MLECKDRDWDINDFVNRKHKINLSPPYQRTAKVWGTSMKQLLMDSIINGYFIPKIYLCELNDGSYDVIDGKQRLTAIFGFIDGEFELAKNSFEFTTRSLDGLEDRDPEPGDRFGDLSSSWKDKIVSFPIRVTIVTGAGELEAEDFFERLNKGKQANSPELRRSIGGGLLKLIQELVNDDFFESKTKLSNDRLLIEDMATRFILIEDLANFSHPDGKPYQDLKRSNLDAVVRSYKVAEEDKSTSRETLNKIKTLGKKVRYNLQVMKDIFEDNSPLLAQSSIQLYYLFVRKIKLEYGHKNLESLLKIFLEDFEVERLSVRDKMREEAKGEDVQPANLSAEELQREKRIRGFILDQSKSNDKRSLERRVDTLTSFFIEKHPDVVCKDEKRFFSRDERFIIFKMSGGVCAGCGEKFKDFSDFEADHKIAWGDGGETTIANAQALHKGCNASKGKK